jgi:pyruvate formate lyase activating enzyme
LLDGVVVSGGEPTLQADLLPFALRLREMGFAVKLDTNGYRPDVLHEVIDRGAVDYVALDVKAPLSDAEYARAAGTRVDVGRIRRSIDLLLDSDIDCEFRTTVVPGMLDEEDVSRIAQSLVPASLATTPKPARYYLQQFVPHNTLDPQMLARTPYSSQRLQTLADTARQWLADVEVRGV